MMTLNDGRSELWQWDTGRTLSVPDDCSQVHFSNKVFGRSVDVDVVDGKASIPDILLQTDKELTAWAFVGTAENGYTKISKVFKVNKRNKPADYVFTAHDQTTLGDILDRIEDLEKRPSGDVSEEDIQNAVNDYLDKNPVSFEEKDPTVPDWAKQASKPAYTAQEVGALPNSVATLPNPHALTIGCVSYDGSEAVEVEIPDGGGVANTIFAGKTASFYGDSLTEENRHYTKGYHKWVQELLGFASYSNYGKSGYKVSDVYDKVNAVDDTADIIFIMCGVNDLIFSVPLGEMGDSTPATTYGSLDMLCSLLKSKYPITPVVFLTPHYETAVQHTGGVTSYEVAKAVREVCQKYAIVVYDNFVNSEIYSTNLSYWTTDNCHWNDKAHEMVGKNLAKFVEDTFRYIYPSSNEGGEGDEGGGGNPAETVTLTGSQNSDVFHFTVLCEKPDDFTGEIVATLRGRNASGFGTSGTAGAGTSLYFGDETGELSNTKFNGTGPTVGTAFEIENGEFTATASGAATKPLETTYVKYIIALPIGSIPMSFILDELRVTVNGVEQEIIKYGGFFVGDTFEITQ